MAIYIVDVECMYGVDNALVAKELAIIREGRNNDMSVSIYIFIYHFNFD
jgi:hypothetical protein